MAKKQKLVTVAYIALEEGIALKNMYRHIHAGHVRGVIYVTSVLPRKAAIVIDMALYRGIHRK